MNFDLVAAPYALIEKIAFGRALERCRTLLLPELPPCRRALLIGEGDGRFLAEFVKASPNSEVDIFDTSARMLEVAEERVRGMGMAGRVRFRHEDVTAADLSSDSYDLVVTHFVLDVFTPDQLAVLLSKLRRAARGGYWLISEFRTCGQSRLARMVSSGVIRLMYAFFRVTADLRVQSIPDYRRALLAAGAELTVSREVLGGFAVTELWRLPS